MAKNSFVAEVSQMIELSNAADQVKSYGFKK